jgi:hypothetical protein
MPTESEVLPENRDEGLAEVKPARLEQQMSQRRRRDTPSSSHSSDPSPAGSLETLTSTPVTSLAAALPITAALLPSEHISHAMVFENELQNRLHAFESAISALEGELDGIDAKYRDEIADLTQRRDKANLDLMRRIEDVRTGKRMAIAALDALDERTRELKNMDHNQTPPLSEPEEPDSALRPMDKSEGAADLAARLHELRERRN